MNQIKIKNLLKRILKINYAFFFTFNKFYLIITYIYKGEQNMKLEVTKLELIKLKRLLKKYKKQNYKKTNETKLITMGSYNSIDISYLAINRFINEEFFYSLNRAKEDIQSIKPIKLIIDNIEYHNINYDKIDSEIRLTINKLGGINVLESLYQLLNEINIFNKELFPIKSNLSNWDSIRKILGIYQNKFL